MPYGSGVRVVVRDTNTSNSSRLNASKMIMRPVQVAGEHLDPCLVQTDCRYDEAPLQEFVRVTENVSPHPRPGVRNRCDDDYGSRLVVRHARAIRYDSHRDH